MAVKKRGKAGKKGLGQKKIQTRLHGTEFDNLADNLADNLPEPVLYQCGRDAAGKLNFTHLSAGAWEWEVATKKLACSDEMFALFGLDRQERVPDLQAEYGLLPPESLEDLREVFQKALDLGDSFGIELEFRKKNGETGWLLVHGEPVNAPDGRVERLVGTALDITGRKRATKAEAFMARMESVGQLAAGIAHDFNNYLATLSLGYELIRASHPGGLDEEFKVVKSTLDAAKRLTNQLLTLAKGGRPVKIRVDLVSLLKETADLALRGSSVECQWRLQAGLPQVLADADQVQQVFSNILINARQAMKEQGRVVIEARAVVQEIGNKFKLNPGTYVKIGFKDNGCGILPEHLEKIYEPYFSTKSTGSGLGMAVAYRIIQQHGGGIHCESIPGKGTLFEAFFPAGDPVSGPFQAVPQAGLSSGGGLFKNRVLILDDEPFMLKCLGLYLGKLGCEVGETRVGEECIALYEKALLEGNPYEVLILDITIKGGLGGVETLAELRKRHPEIKAIASSGYSKQGVLSQYEEYGFSAVLPKPYSVEKLGEVLREVLDGVKSRTGR